MAGLLSMLNLARDGVLAQTAAINVTTQNVDGANAPGFVRRVPVLESVSSGGVQMTKTTRSFDRFAYSQLVDQESRLSSATARAGTLSTVEALVAPATDNIGTRADALFDAFHDLAVNPTDTAARSTVLSAASWLASGFSETADNLEKLRGELGSQAKDVVSEVNDRLNTLTDIDKEIVQATGRGEDASALRDRRDQLVRDIGSRIGARSVEAADGSLTLFAAGTVLFEGGRAATLSVSLDTNGSLQIDARRDNSVTNITSNVQTGSLAGIREVRDSDIPSISDGLDAFARDISTTLNAVHASGVGLDGTSGRPLFTTPPAGAGAAHAMALNPDLIDHPEFVAASGSAGGLPGGNETATALADLGQGALASGKTASAQFAGIASKVGALRNVADSEQQTREDTVTTASTLRESVSGVSTDEEMIALQQYQRGFEASTRVLQTLNELFDSLLKGF